MSILKCKLCGGKLEVNGDTGIAKCPYCNVTQTLSRRNDEKILNLYEIARMFMKNHKWDDAAREYEQILALDTSDAEVYWSLLLCKYGVLYVEDDNGDRKVTLNRMEYTSIYDDELYRQTLNHATIQQKMIYEADARSIEEIKKKFIEISRNEEPFDVFICFKDTVNGKRTEDSDLAKEIYYRLEEEGYKVFFSRFTLENKLGTEYEPYIFAALDSAKVMVTVGTRPDYYQAEWVKNEWKRFLILVNESRGKKCLIPTYKYMNPEYLPDELKYLQALDMNSPTYIQDLVRNIKKYIDPKPKEKEIKHTVISPTTAYVESRDNLEALLIRAEMCLEDEDFEKADELCERVLDNDPYNAKAYFIKLLLEYDCTSDNDLLNIDKPFTGSKNYAKIVKFGDEETLTRIRDLVAKFDRKYKDQNHKKMISEYEDEKDNYYDRLYNVIEARRDKLNEQFDDLFDESIARAYNMTFQFDDITEVIEECEEYFEEVAEELGNSKYPGDEVVLEECKNATNEIIRDIANEINEGAQSYTDYRLVKLLYTRTGEKDSDSMYDLDKQIQKCKSRDANSAFEQANTLDDYNEIIEFLDDIKDNRETKELIVKCNEKIEELSKKYLWTLINSYDLWERYDYVSEELGKYKNISCIDEINKEFIKKVDEAFTLRTKRIINNVIDNLSKKGRKDYQQLNSIITTTVNKLEKAEETEVIKGLTEECNSTIGKIEKDMAYYDGYELFIDAKAWIEPIKRVPGFEKALEKFKLAAGWKNSDEFINKLSKDIKEIKKNENARATCGPIYEEAWKLYLSRKIDDVEESIKLYNKIAGYEDADKCLCMAERKLKRLTKVKHCKDIITAIYTWIKNRIIWILIILIASITFIIYVRNVLFPNFCLNRYEHYLSKGEGKKAIQELSWGRYNSDINEDYYNKVIKAGDILCDYKKYVEAIDLYTIALENEKTLQTVKQKMNKVSVKAAKELVDEKQFVAAANLIDRTSEDAEGYADMHDEVYYKWAEDLYNQNYCTDAYLKIKQVLKLDQNDPIYSKIIVGYLKEEIAKNNGRITYSDLIETLDHNSEDYKELKYLNALTWPSALDSIKAFESLGNYKDSEEIFEKKTMEWLDANQSAANSSEYYNYLVKMKNRGNVRAQELYKTLYRPRVTNIAINQSKNSTSQASSVSKYSHWYVHYNVDGGIPGNGVSIKRVAKYPDGTTVTNTDVYNSSSNNYWVEYYYNNPYQGASGSFHIYFYDTDGNLIGNKMITIN